jgi:hypothetical protein
MSQLRENQHFDREGHHAGQRSNDSRFALQDQEKARTFAPASDRGKANFFHFGQTPILARVETALAELGQQT